MEIWKICAHRKEIHQDSEGGTQEPQSGQATKKLPRYTTQYNKSCPATALFGRPMKTKLLEVTTRCSDTEIHERDRKAKAKMKKHADN